MSIPTKNINAEKIQGNLDVTSISGGTIFSGGTLLQTVIQNIISANQTTGTTGTTGSVAFFGTGNTITQDNSNLFWDNTNKRLGIRSATEASFLNGGGLVNPPLQVHSSGTSFPSFAFADNSQGALVLFNKGLSWPTNTVSLILNNHNNDGNAAYTGFEIRNSSALAIPGWLTEFRYRGTSPATMLAMGGGRINFYPGGSGAVGINLASSSTAPSATLHIRGNGTTSSTFGLQVHNSTGNNNALVVRDDGFVTIGTATPVGLLTVAQNVASPNLHQFTPTLSAINNPEMFNSFP